MSSNNGQPLLPLIMNIPDEESSSSATMNDLPNEILPLIFKHLRIEDLFQCRLVCERFMIICDEVKIAELIVSNEIENFKDLWFHTNVQFNHKDDIDIATYKMCQSTFRLNKCLKRLYFKGSYSDFKQLDLNQLTHLEQLRLHVPGPCDPDDNVIDIDLPNLKILDIGYIDHGFDIHLTAPKLEMLKFYEYDLKSVTYPESVVHLETTFHELSTEPLFENLQYLKVDDGFVLNGKILSVYPKLTTLVCNQHIYHGNDEPTASIVGLRDLVKQKRILKRHDLKIYYQSVEVVDSSKIDEYESAESVLAFQMNNYDLLCDNIDCIDYELDYNELMRVVKGKLPQDFHKKFFNVKAVKVTKKLKDLDFLKCFDYLDELHLKKSLLDQSFYDRLPELQQLTILNVENSWNPIANYDFLFKFRRLQQFETDRDFTDFPDFSLALFNELKYFAHISFYYNKDAMSISKFDSNTFLVNRVKDRKGDLKVMSLDELVSFVNGLKNMKSISRDSI